LLPRVRRFSLFFIGIASGGYVDCDSGRRLYMRGLIDGRAARLQWHATREAPRDVAAWEGSGFVELPRTVPDY